MRQDGTTQQSDFVYENLSQTLNSLPHGMTLTENDGTLNDGVGTSNNDMRLDSAETSDVSKIFNNARLMKQKLPPIDVQSRNNATASSQLRPTAASFGNSEMYEHIIESQIPPPTTAAAQSSK